MTPTPTAVNFHRLPLSSQKVLAILGLSDPGTRLRFYRSASRAGHILVCLRDDRHLSPTAENLRRLGVSFVRARR
ncbi:hypothetical protein [Deinococcus altitudinis]|uniref:hypothetical protein n=1 Tax=Deinococcus altitudinis TaxID=468914 RepID=UPI0038920333